MPEVATDLCANADIISWFYSLELSNQISIIGIIVSIIASITSFALGVISLILSHRYKSQADEFADLQFMPDFYQYNMNYTECAQLNASVKYDATQTAPLPQIYCAQESPIYNLNISYLSVDGKRIGDIATYKSLDIYPTNIYFKIQIFLPDSFMFDNEKHIAQAIFSYESKYGVRYSKRMTIEFASGRISKILLDRPEREKHG